MAVILGHDRAVGRFADAMQSGALHHAWLLGGPVGVGKAHFARLAATRILASAAGPPVTMAGLDTPADHPMARLMAAGSHPDFRLLERLERPGGGLARNITVKQVRGLGELFGVTPFLSPWRVVVIDAADDLEGEGANALLKTLEEPPPNSLFLLVAHAPGRLLPTIRSRCRRLEFGALDDAALTAVLRHEMPAVREQELAELVALAGGSVGRALSSAELGLAALQAEALVLLREGDPTNARRVKLAQSLSGKAAAERYAAFLHSLPSLIATEARRLERGHQARALDAYAEARKTARVALRLSLDPAATVFQLGSILAAVP